ncbi:MAG TPA: sigma-70 family RNA polymerase sigma factor [Planctomycetota bacterium]|nr:sigma-70 family RNA polymerase sigma factor [Planctomycetota bacterium]
MPARPPINEAVRVLGRMPPEEVRWILRAQAGDAEAFRELFERYRTPVYATIERMVGGWYPNDVDDFAQDVFLKVFRALPRFDFARRTKFSTWLYTFVRNYCFDVMKRHAVRPAVSSLARLPGEEGDRPVLDPAPPPAAAAAREEAGEVVRRAVQSLPPALREVVILRQYEGLSFRDIGEIVGSQEGTAKARYHRARALLRERLEPFVREGALGPSLRDREAQA